MCAARIHSTRTFVGRLRAKTRHLPHRDRLVHAHYLLCFPLFQQPRKMHDTCTICHAQRAKDRVLPASSPGTIGRQPLRGRQGLSALARSPRHVASSVDEHALLLGALQLVKDLQLDLREAALELCRLAARWQAQHCPHVATNTHTRMSQTLRAQAEHIQGALEARAWRRAYLRTHYASAQRSSRPPSVG